MIACVGFDQKACREWLHSNGPLPEHFAPTAALEDSTNPAGRQVGSDSSLKELAAARAAEILDDIRRNIGRRPEEARRAALQLVRLLSRPATADAAGDRGGLAPWRARKIDRYLRGHLREEMPVRALARQIQLSVSHFCRAFKETFGCTPHAYILRLRLELAQELMLSTQDPITQVAFEAGFADLSHLSKAFRRELGESPSIWRRRNLIDSHDGLNVNSAARGDRSLLRK